MCIRDRFRRGEALLRELGVGEEWLHRETVWPLLVVGESVLALEPRPERRVACGTDRDRLALEVLDFGDTRMRDQHGRVLLERRRDRGQRDLLLGGGQHLQ